jgi:hypothetical protein
MHLRHEESVNNEINFVTFKNHEVDPQKYFVYDFN